MTTDKLTAEHYLLQEHKIPVFNNFMSFGELLVASAATQGALESIPESKGKKITGIAGGHRKLFIFEEENQTENVVTALHSETEDLLVYDGCQVLPIQEIVLALEGNKISQIKCGKEHNIIMTQAGAVFAFGKGSFGALGLGGFLFAQSPRQLTKLANKKIVSVACGMHHSLALSDIGDVYSWGRGFEGQLGLLEHVEAISTPRCIPHFFKYSKQSSKLQKTSIHFVACGAYHSIAVDCMGQIYCWGEARYGQTGSGKKSREPFPVKLLIEVGGEKRKLMMASGGFGHTLCLTHEGEIFSWGLNIKGQLGLNDLPQHISTNSELAYVKASYIPVAIISARDKSKLPRFMRIACGFCSSYAIDEDGSAWGWGGSPGLLVNGIQRGPTRLTVGTENKKFSNVFANDDSVVFFSPFQPLFFKPALVPSRGATEVTFFGNGFTDTGNQCIRFRVLNLISEMDLSYDAKTDTFYCRTPAFEKLDKKLVFPQQCHIQISLDRKTYVPFDKPLLVYSSKLQIQSIDPICGSALGTGEIRIYMPLDELTQKHVEAISVGFKNNNNHAESHHQDWICSEGFYHEDTIVCKIPNLPHFDPANPFYLIDVSLNGQQFTDAPHTFRYYFVSDTAIAPSEGWQDSEPEIVLSGKGFFDAPAKKLKISLQFSHKQQQYDCERTVEMQWHKAERHFTFKMPKLSWLIGDHQITPDLLQTARKSAAKMHLSFCPLESMEIGRYTYKVPPPPVEPQEQKKDPKKDAKKPAKK